MRLLFILIALIFAPVSLTAQSENEPFSVRPLFDLSKPEKAGLSFPEHIEHFTVFDPDSSQNTYNHGVVLYPFKGKLYAMWQSSKKDEDAPDTHVLYSVSSNGETWSSPKPLTQPKETGITTSGGWWSYGDTLIAYINTWPTRDNTPRQGYTKFKKSTDGNTWTDSKYVVSSTGNPVKGIIEQDLKTIESGRIITAFHIHPGLIATPFYTDHTTGTTGWKAGEMSNLPSDDPVSRELEPSWFIQEDGTVVMVFRDQESTHKKLAAVSKDQGRTWTKPVLIDTPDSRSKQSAGNLPDGTAYMVNNPSDNKTRYPLAITLSDNGYTFDRAYLLRSGGDDLQPLEYPGKYKRAGYSYPKSVVWGDFLYISYATNKEDVEVTRVPLSSLE